MPVRPEINGVFGQFAEVGRALDFVALAIAHLETIATQIDNVALLEIDHAARHLQQGGSIRGGKHFAIAHAKKQRCALTRNDRAARIRFADHGNGKRACQLDYGCTGGGKNVRGFLQMFMDQMGNDFGIGIRGERVSRCAKPVAYRFVVFDDAVMHHGDAGADMGMRILFRGFAVRGPARMGNARIPGQLFALGGSGKFGNPAGTAQALQCSIDGNGNAR